ncbi:hypothetical protein EDB81DRAFT_845469 [Dactylonectria macrodidyma]|uniref:Cerato-platanin n=1 Tax=Dactylonectria macrodidyma TaxID=307937 RepID=A0A9P9E8S6_9HYPO|nr:hypothetical protein EDB81DRAFT_845469 [Dactylonectria macrodidyma]
MIPILTTLLAILAAATASEYTGNSYPNSGSISVTPHDQYSSSVGVLGCKINTDRVAYWPTEVGCDNICVKVTYEGREAHLLKIDQSQGAFDISYDAWNYLYVGRSATEDPQHGGGLSMKYETVQPSECLPLLDNGKLPLSAANSMEYVAYCLSQPNSWVAQNHELYNINDPQCTSGVDELCSLDLAKSNQPSCPTTLGAPGSLDLKVKDIPYNSA